MNIIRKILLILFLILLCNSILYFIFKKVLFLVLIPILLIIILIIYIGDKVHHKNKQKKLRTLAKDTAESFNINGIDYWTDYGTLLGIVREGDIISYDEDCDFCLVYSPETERELHQKMLDVVKTLRQKDPDYILEYHTWGCYRIRHQVSPSVYADLYLTRSENDLWIDPTGEVKKDLIGTPKSINWQGVQIKIPEYEIGVLESRYGKDWKVPKRY